jgi:hypothetical protein
MEPQSSEAERGRGREASGGAGRRPEPEPERKCAKAYVSGAGSRPLGGECSRTNPQAKDRDTAVQRAGRSAAQLAASK